MFQAGLSEFHKLVVTVLKYTFPKSPSKVVTYKVTNTFQTVYYEMILKIIWNQNKIWLLNLLVLQDLQKYS